MTRADIRNELVAFRFNANQTTSMDYWINLAYQQLWGFEEWPWRRVSPANVTVSSGNIGTVTPPAQMHRPLRLFDDNGYPLSWRTAKEFSDVYQSNTSPGTPSEWTIYNGVIYVGPGPTTTKTFKLSYIRRIAHLAAGTTDTAGVMSDDADVPSFPPEWHYMLVFGAAALGQRLLSDPTFGNNEEAWQTGLQLMKSEFMPADQPEPAQYGRLPWA